MFQDRRLPTEEQRRKLCEMLYQALLEIRILGWTGKADQAADLADAFHNVPTGMWQDDFSLAFFRVYLEAYQKKYARPLDSGYCLMLDEVMKTEG